MNTFAFPDKDTTIVVYGFLADTGEYIGKSDCFIPAHTGLPAYCTHIAPPLAQEGKTVIFDSSLGDWKLASDYRGKTAYDTETREPTFINSLGELPKSLTLQEPSSEFDRWNGSEWVKDESAEKQHLQQSAELEKRQRTLSASERIEILTDKINLGMAENEEVTRANILAWRKYRAQLDDVNTALAGEASFSWPKEPVEQ